jgi:hypothetical protein
MEETEYEGDYEDQEQEGEPEIEGDEGQDGQEYQSEEDPPEEDSEEPDEAPREKPEKIDIRERLAQVQKDRYQALREMDSLRQENEILRKQSEISANQALKQYDENLSRRYENARIAKIRAMEEGDVQAQVDADSDLSLISAEVYQTNLIKAQNNLQANQRQNPEYSLPDNSHHVNRWAQENQWFTNPRNQDEFDMANQVKNWCQEFNSNLYQGGRPDLIESPEYLYKLDEYVESLRNYTGQRESSNQRSQKRELSMRQSRSPISPVRNGTSQNSRGRQTAKLTEEERESARIWGLSEQEFLREKIEDERENANLRFTGR